MSLAQQRGWRVSRAERIPHDLWAAGALPDLSAAEQLTLLLVGFDLSFKTQARDRSLEIVPLQPVTVRREYRVPSRSSDSALLRQELQTAPSARMEDSKLVVDARVEQHERLAEIIAGRAVPPRSRRPATESARQYTLRVQDQPVGAILRQLAERMNWTMEFDEASIRAAGLSLDTSRLVQRGEWQSRRAAPGGVGSRRLGLPPPRRAVSHRAALRTTVGVTTGGMLSAPARKHVCRDNTCRRPLAASEGMPRIIMPQRAARVVRGSPTRSCRETSWQKTAARRRNSTHSHRW